MSLIEDQISIIGLKHWIIGAHEINSTEEAVWAPSSAQWATIYNKIKECNCPVDLQNETIVGYNEFKTWMAGIVDLLGDDSGDWTPSRPQWLKIYEKICAISDVVTQPELYFPPNVRSINTQQPLMEPEQAQYVQPTPQFVAPPTSSFNISQPGNQNGYTSPFGV